MDQRIYCGNMGSRSQYRALPGKSLYRRNTDIARLVFHHTPFRRLHPSVFLLPTRIFRLFLSFLTSSRLYLDASHPFFLLFIHKRYLVILSVLLLLYDLSVFPYSTTSFHGNPKVQNIDSCGDGRYQCRWKFRPVKRAVHQWESSWLYYTSEAGE